MADLFTAVKTALRVSHDRLDGEIQDMIDAARADMVRAGVSEEAASEEENPLVRDAVKVYCLMRFTTDTDRYNRFFESWQYQLDCLRKSRGFKAVDSSVQ